jgi:hypothetical protein
VETSVTATVVPRARLTLEWAIDSPPEALDRSVTIGSEFTIRAWVENVSGGSGLLPNPTLTMETPENYDNLSDTTQAFAIGETVYWTLRAPPTPSGPDEILVTIDAATAIDENSVQGALITLGQGAIPIVTEGATVRVANVSAKRGLDTKVVPGGATDVRKLGFTLTYVVTDPLVSDARIDTIAVGVLGRDSTLLSNDEVRNTVDRVFIELQQTGASFEVIDPTTNPVVVGLTGNDRFIEPDSTATVEVGIDLRDSPVVSELSLNVNSDGLRVKDSVSGQPLGVFDSNNQSLDSQLRSTPLVILSGEFAEYVHNYPNPFQAGYETTRITYFLDPGGGDVSIKIYDLLGKLVFTLDIPSGQPGATGGPQEYEWDGRNMQSEVVRNGIYVCVVSAGVKTAKFKIAVAK